MEKAFCIYGASGHSKVIIEILERSGSTIKGLFDDDPTKKMLFEYVVSDKKSFLDLPGSNWIIGIGNNETRKKIAENNLLYYETIIDLSANVSKRTKLGRGIVIMPGVTVNSSSIIGDHGIINTNSSIDHDCVLGDYVHVSPNATLCGGVKIGEGVHIGAEAVIIPGIRVGKWTKIGAGSVIIKDVPDHVTIAGNPGKIIKLHNKQ